MKEKKPSSSDSRGNLYLCACVRARGLCTGPCMTMCVHEDVTYCLSICGKCQQARCFLGDALKYTARIVNSGQRYIFSLYKVLVCTSTHTHAHSAISEEKLPCPGCRLRQLGFDSTGRCAVWAFVSSLWQSHAHIVEGYLCPGGRGPG